ncbi:MAG: hypothetical protein LQ340_006770 [Diploschistes diacapsis]|nr:MAG: hypothetical protein LQ340_006770 [Diploschistes diacapsis]
MDDMYHEGEGHFDEGSAKPSGAATPMDSDANVAKPAATTTTTTTAKRGPRGSKKAKTMKQRLAIIDGSGDA